MPEKHWETKSIHVGTHEGMLRLNQALAEGWEPLNGAVAGEAYNHYHIWFLRREVPMADPAL